MYNNFKVCRFFIKFCVPSFIPDMFMVLINQTLRVSLPSFRTVSVLPGNRREQRVNKGRFCTGHMSGQPRHVEQGKSCDCQLLNHAGPWDQSHSVTRKDGTGSKGCGSVEGEVEGLKDGWVEKRGWVRFKVTETGRSGGKHVWLFRGCQKFETSLPQRADNSTVSGGRHALVSRWHPAVPLCETQRMPPPDTATIF